MSYSRSTTIDSGPTGDTVVQAVLDLDADLTTVFANLNTHEALTTASHGLTSGEGDIVGTDALQTLTRKTITSPTITGGTATNLVMTGLSASLPVFTSSNSTLTSKSVADTLTALGIGAWTDYSASSTVTGWAEGYDADIYYKIVEKIVFVKFRITGTSNSTAAGFTVPVAHTSDVCSCFGCAQTSDNGTSTSTGGRISFAAEKLVLVSKDMAGTTFTASGSKAILGHFFYGID